MSTLQVLLLVLASIVSTPIIVFFSVKLGTYAFYRGKQIFEQEQGKNGKATRKERETFVRKGTRRES